MSEEPYPVQAGEVIEGYTIYKSKKIWMAEVAVKGSYTKDGGETREFTDPPLNRWEKRWDKTLGAEAWKVGLARFSIKYWDSFVLNEIAGMLQRHANLTGVDTTSEAEAT